jgi:hypothetical protein
MFLDCELSLINYCIPEKYKPNETFNCRLDSFELYVDSEKELGTCICLVFGDNWGLWLMGQVMMVARSQSEN